MEKLLPSYKAFIKIEKDTLKVIHDYLSQWPLFSATENAAKISLYAPIGTRFIYHNYWDTEYKNMACRIFIGAEVNKQGGGSGIANTSYCICIFEKKDNNPLRVLRKYHFDYITPQPKQRDPHPWFHLQYAGGLPKELKSIGVTQEHIEQLNPDIEGPRIFYSPMTIGLLMNLAFHEFPCSETDEILKRGEWRNLVCKDQTQILAPFYERCYNLTRNKDVPFYDKAYVWPKAS